MDGNELDLAVLLTQCGTSSLPLADAAALHGDRAVVALVRVTAKAPACRRSGTQMSLVRPWPTACRDSPVSGAAVARTTGAMSVTGSAGLAITMSRSARGNSSVISTTLPAVLVGVEKSHDRRTGPSATFHRESRVDEVGDQGIPATLRNRRSREA